MCGWWFTNNFDDTACLTDIFFTVINIANSSVVCIATTMCNLIWSGCAKYHNQLSSSMGPWQCWLYVSFYRFKLNQYYQFTCSNEGGNIIYLNQWPVFSTHSFFFSTFYNIPHRHIISLIWQGMCKLNVWTHSLFN